MYMNKTRSKNSIQKYVGVLTVPLASNSMKYRQCGSSYVNSSHIDWLKSQNIGIIGIPYYSKNLNKYVKRVHGIYLPSGTIGSKPQPEYYYAVKKLMKLAKRENDLGNYFPVWGVCMGFQQMIIAQDGRDKYKDFLQKFKAYDDLYLPLELMEEGKNARIFSLYSKDQINNMEIKNVSLHNHMMGISPSVFKRNKNLSKFYKIVNISYDRENKPFVSTIEAYDYPFYGVQWHPERKRYFYKLAQFFSNEVKKNKKNISNKDRTRTLKKNRIKCIKYSNNIYKKCDFFYDEDDPIVNTKKCNLVT